MEKRYQAIDGMISVTVLIVLTGSQLAKLESPDYRKQIESLAKDLNLEWAVEQNGNVSQAAISKLCGPVVSSRLSHELEMKAIAFMNKVDEIVLPLSTPNEEEYNEEHQKEDLAVIKKLWEDLNLPKDADERVLFAAVADNTTQPLLFLPTAWGKIGYYSLKEMVKLYLKAHE